MAAKEVEGGGGEGVSNALTMPARKSVINKPVARHAPLVRALRPDGRRLGVLPGARSWVVVAPRVSAAAKRHWHDRLNCGDGVGAYGGEIS